MKHARSAAPPARATTTPEPARILLPAALLLLSACGEAPAPEPVTRERPVKFFEVEVGGGTRTQEYPGEVRATDSAQVGFEVPGRVISLSVREGQQVAAGELLAQLDARDYQAQFDIAEANLRKARADLARSERINAEDPGAITRERIDADRRAVEVAEARAAQARKAVTDTELRAPFDGVVSRRLIEEFENVQAKEPVLIVDDLTRVEVEVNVPERDIITRRPEQRGYDDATLDALTRSVAPTVTFSALEDLSLSGRITEIATRADPSTRTFAVRIAIEPPIGVAVLPGMTARVTGRFEEDGGEVKIPISSLVATPDGRGRVWVIDAREGTVSGRDITLGAMSGAEVTVLAGLSPGEVIAATGAAQLAEGMRVTRFR